MAKKSVDGNIYAQVFFNRAFFYDIYTMDIIADAGIALKTFITEL